MLIYGVSGIFAHKKTIKQLLQPMIEQVLRGVDVPGECAAIFGSVFQSYYIFVSVFFFNSPLPFLGSILYQYLHTFLLYIMCISSKSQTVFWAQNFRDVQLIPNY